MVVFPLPLCPTMADPSIGARIQDVRERPRLEAEFLGDKLVLSRVNNTHGGCFFLNRRQMEHWAGRPYFLDRDTSFAGPLESAATLGITKTFRVYKPARENAAFLEVHGGCGTAALDRLEREFEGDGYATRLREAASPCSAPTTPPSPSAPSAAPAGSRSSRIRS